MLGVRIACKSKLPLCAALLALASTIVIRANFTDGETEYFVSNSIRNLLAITTGFLWLRILSFIKGINMQLATFVLAILQVGALFLPPPTPPYQYTTLFLTKFCFLCFR